MSGRRRLLAVVLAGALLTGCGDDGYEPVGPFRPLPEGAPPEVGPADDARRPSRVSRPSPGSGQDGGDPNVVASGLERADRARRSCPTAARSSASARPAGSCRSSPTAHPRAS